MVSGSARRLQLGDPGGHVRRAGGYIEQPLLTAGDDLAAVTELHAEGQESYSAADVIQYLLSVP